jgi:hypothetical protein
MPSLTSLRGTIFKYFKPLCYSSLPGENRFELDQRQLVLDVSYSVQNNEEQLVAKSRIEPSSF